MSFLKILSISYYLILENGTSMDRFPKWSIIHKHPYGENLPTQRISELFDSISESDKDAFLICIVTRGQMI
ncbi:MAG: hypothetical protein LBE09_01345 [Christensenellaceae bacterium]|nr:hypothetical protein [Christensenellaceae bacterium]